MAVEIAAPIAIAAFLILTGNDLSRSQPSGAREPISRAAPDAAPSAGGAPLAICIIPNCGRRCPPHEAFCPKHRGT
jgi:hypothetical protein